MIAPEHFKAAVSRFASGVTVVTVSASGTLHGMTASAFSSLSLDPPLVLVCVAREAWMHDLLTGAEGFGVNLLADDQAGLASWFATPERPLGPAQFEGFEWEPAHASGAPVLAGSLAHLDCDVHEILPGGDHTIVLGVVRHAEVVEDRGPLVYFRGRFGRFLDGPPET